MPSYLARCTLHGPRITKMPSGSSSVTGRKQVCDLGSGGPLQAGLAWRQARCQATTWHLCVLQVTLMGHDLVLWKEPGVQGAWSCLDNACPHRYCMQSGKSAKQAMLAAENARQQLTQFLEASNARQMSNAVPKKLLATAALRTAVQGALYGFKGSASCVWCRFVTKSCVMVMILLALQRRACCLQAGTDAQPQWQFAAPHSRCNRSLVFWATCAAAH